MLLWRMWMSLLLLGLLALMAILICRSRVRHVPFRVSDILGAPLDLRVGVGDVISLPGAILSATGGVSLTMRQWCCVCMLIGMMAVC
jgi:hypothetical protein